MENKGVKVVRLRLLSPRPPEGGGSAKVRSPISTATDEPASRGGKEFET
jgi:hypothetical protein